MEARQGQIPGNGRAKASPVTIALLLIPTFGPAKAFLPRPNRAPYCTAGTRDNRLAGDKAAPTPTRAGNGRNGLAEGEAKRGRGCRDPGPVIKQRRRRWDGNSSGIFCMENLRVAEVCGDPALVRSHYTYPGSLRCEKKRRTEDKQAPRGTEMEGRN